MQAFSEDMLVFNSLHTNGGDICPGSHTYANCFDPDQEPQNVGPDLRFKLSDYFSKSLEEHSFKNYADGN